MVSIEREKKNSEKKLFLIHRHKEILSKVLKMATEILWDLIFFRIFTYFYM